MSHKSCCLLLLFSCLFVVSLIDLGLSFFKSNFTWLYRWLLLSITPNTIRTTRPAPHFPAWTDIIIRLHLLTIIPRQVLIWMMSAYAFGHMSLDSICIRRTTTTTTTIPMPHWVHPTGRATIRVSIKITGVKSSLLTYQIVVCYSIKVK